MFCFNKDFATLAPCMNQFSGINRLQLQFDLSKTF